MKFCPECEQRSYEEDVCTNCGLVFEDRPIDYRPPVSLIEKSAEDRTHIIHSKFQRGIKKNSIVHMREVKNPDLKRALGKYYYPWQDKRDSQIKKELKRIVGKLNLGLDFYSACFYRYNKIAKYNDEKKRNLFKGAGKVSIEIVAQGITFLEIKQQGIPRTLKDFARIGCNKKDVNDYYKRLLTEFNIKIKPQSPFAFINVIISGLELEPRTEYLLSTSTRTFMEKILEIERIRNLPSQFRNPIDKAGSYVYLLCSENGITQEKICEIVGCNVQTLRKRINEIKAIINDSFRMFGVNEDDYEVILECGEYEDLVNNAAKACDSEVELINCLINPEFCMEVEYAEEPNKGRRIKPIFSCVATKETRKSE